MNILLALWGQFVAWILITLAVLVVITIFSFISLLPDCWRWLQALRSSRVVIKVDPTHRGPYRPPLDNTDEPSPWPSAIRCQPKPNVYLRYVMRIVGGRNAAPPLIKNNPGPDRPPLDQAPFKGHLKAHAKESVAAYREKQERDRLSLISGSLRDRRN